MSEITTKKPSWMPTLSGRDKALLIILVALIGAAFYPMWNYLPKVWFDKDGYYSHGVLVPLLSGYLVWLKRKQLAAATITPSWLGLPLLLLGLAGAIFSKRIDSQTIFQASFFAFLFGASLFMFGAQITRLLALPLLFLGFMLPLPDFLFDSYTNPVQAASTKVADKYLQWMRFNTLRVDNLIYMDHYTLNVGIPCSGFKLSISLLTFTVFCIAIARLSWWKNLVLLASLVPIAVAINALRIALIGIVGELVWVNQSEEAGHQWGTFTHDWSGYLLLFLAFGIFFGLARLLGWNPSKTAAEDAETTDPPAKPMPAKAYNHLYINLGLLAVAATAVMMIQRVVPPLAASEPEIRAKVPMALGGWSGTPDRDMGKDTYDTLRPDGIVWRSYQDKQGVPVDFVMLTATHSSAFHDPTVCFTNQGQKIVENVTGSLKIASLNQQLPVRLLRLKNDHDGSYMTAVYWWRSPGGRNINDPTSMQLESWWNKLLGLKGNPGYFFRIIVAESPDRVRDIKEIERFVSDVFAVLSKTYPDTIGR